MHFFSWWKINCTLYCYHVSFSVNFSDQEYQMSSWHMWMEFCSLLNIYPKPR
jgi:hypothetical protein